MMPAADTSSTSTQRSDEQREQVDDVEVVDERVGELDERPDEQRLVLHQRPPA